MTDTLIHDLAVELAHACHEDDTESAYRRERIEKTDLPFLADDEYVVVEYRRRKYNAPSVRTVPYDYDSRVVWAAI